jgi:hypothetical protein
MLFFRLDAKLYAEIAQGRAQRAGKQSLQVRPVPEFS